MKNCNSQSNSFPALRLDINIWNLDDLPAFSAGPKGSDDEKYQTIKKAGFAGVQDGNPVLCAKYGLNLTGQHRMNKVGDLDEKIHEWTSAPYDCATIHVGWGMESDLEANRMIEYVLNLSSKFDFPIYIETHRATITQDMWRTVEFVKRFPELRFNGDFSHWYAGLEMVNGIWEDKMHFIQPVLDRVRFIHGRIADPGSIQVDISDQLKAPFVKHFREFWKKSFQGFLKTAMPGDFICFTPELLPATYYYARKFKQQSGEYEEEGDRWNQALLLSKIAQECWEEAKKAID